VAKKFEFILNIEVTNPEILLCIYLEGLIGLLLKFHFLIFSYLSMKSYTGGLHTYVIW